MANPNFPSDGQSERIDALVHPDGTVYLKAGIGSITVTGADNNSAGHLVGTHLDAATAGSTDPVVVAAGLNGTTVKHLALDSSGRLIPVGQDAVGGAPTVNPFGVAGFDGTDLQYLTVGSDGRLQIAGPDAAGAAPTINPIATAWWDGTLLRRPRTDTNGYTLPVGSGYTDGSGTVFNQRFPNVFKTVSATASGNTAVWTPTSGKKFRLMRFCVSLTSNVAISSGAVVTVKFQDATTDTAFFWSVFVPTTAVTTGAGDSFVSPWIDLGGAGFLSAAANNVLNVNLSATLTSGACRVMAAGTEE